MTFVLLACALAATPAFAANPHTGLSPSTDQCKSCHAGHGSPSSSSLLTESDQKALCYVCHDGTQSAYNVQQEFGDRADGSSSKASRHPVSPGQLECSGCHTPHRGPLEGNPMSLAAGASDETTGNAVCGSCHGAGSSLPQGDMMTNYVGTAHDTSMSASETGGSSIKCLACHEPHGSDNTALIATTVRSLSGETRTVSVNASTGSTPLCVGCHDTSDGTFGGGAAYMGTPHSSATTSTVASVNFPGTTGDPGDCDNCHSPHGTGKPHMARAAGDDLCYGCHDAAGTTKPAGYSYQGKSAYQGSGHATMNAGDIPQVVSLTASSTDFQAFESTQAPTPSSPGTPMTAEKTQRLVSVDSSYAVTSLATATGQHDYQVYRFKVPADVADTQWLNLSWAGYGEELAGYETSVSVWSKSANGGSGGWSRISNGLMADRTAVTAKLANAPDLIDANGYVWVMGDAKNVRQSTIVGTPSVSFPTSTTAQITWTTEGYASSWVDYGITSSYGSTVGTNTRTVSHSVTVPITAGGKYRFQVRGTARDGDSSSSGELGFSASVVTLVPAPDLSGTQTTFSQTFNWAHNDPAGEPYTYDIRIRTAYYPYDQTLTGLTASTLTTDVFCYGSSYAIYDWQVRGRDKDGYYTPWSAIDQFTVRDLTPNPGGSCPFLFVWNGFGYGFEADINTAGMIGSKNTSGYIKPDPKDRYILTNPPAETLGGYEFRMVEERNEIDYTDELKLYTVDLPEGVELVAEKGERGGTSPAFPGGLHTVQNLRAPVSVYRTDTGEDVTDAIALTDEQRVQLNEDANIGFDYKTLEIDLGDVSGAPQVKIVMNAQSLRPFTPEGLARQRSFGAGTKLEVQRTDGTWELVPTSEATLPNAMEFGRTYAFDITKAMHDTTGKVRFTYLFKTYIDMIGVDTSLDIPVYPVEVPMTSASLGSHGVDSRSNSTDIYKYVYGTQTGEGSLFPGAYTRYGDVTPLLQSTDDKFVVYGQGDELTLRFLKASEPAPGTRRSFVVYVDGYYKSMKSAVEHAVDPMPFAAMSNFPYGADEHYPDDADHVAYQQEYNTRLVEATTSAAPPLVATAESASTLHRSLNVDFVSVDVGIRISASEGGTGCTVCHAVHGGGAKNADGTETTGTLVAPEPQLCTGFGSGGCHDNATRTAAGVNVNERITASGNNLTHHDLTEFAQAQTGARITCTNCHDPHTNNALSPSSNPDAITASLPTSMGPYLDANGATYLLVGAMHDATAPTITSGPTIAGAGSGSTVLTPTVTWTTNEPSTSWIDFGVSSGVYMMSFGNNALVTSHTATATGLEVDTTYYWRARTVDALGNVRTSAEATYSTTMPAGSITSGPTLSGNGWSNYQTPSVTWTTSDQFSTILEWGTSSGSYTSDYSASAMTTAHAAAMSGLTTDTVYYWRVRGVDAIGRSVTSAEATYQASPPAQPVILTGPIISGPTWSTFTSPTVAWTTSGLTTSWLQYGTSSGSYTSSVGTNTLSTTHSVTASSLTSGTVYYMRVFGLDPVNRLVVSNEFTYTPTTPAAPIITAGPTIDGSTYAKSSSPVITWTTGDIASTWVDWGTSPGVYTSNVNVAGNTTGHTVTLSGMTYGTTYYWRARSVDPDGRIVTSGESAYTPVAYPSPSVASVAPNPAYYDSSIQAGAAVSASCTVSTIANSNSLEYRLLLDNVAYGSWQSSTEWTLPTVGVGTHGLKVAVRDAATPSSVTTGTTETYFDVVDTWVGWGSCPFVYTWDGSSYRFEADTLTAARIGGPTATGFQQPNPNDAYVVKTVPAVEDGTINFRLVEERKEVDYLDTYKLFAVDAPASLQVFAEKAVAGVRTFPPLGSALHTVRALRAPVSAVRTDTGEDVLAAISTDDGDRIALNESAETSFTYKTIELDLGDQVATAPQVKVVMNALSEFPVTPEGIERRFTFGAPTKLAVQDADGTWRSVTASVGAVPAAPEFERPYVFDLTKAVKGTTGKVRFTFLFRTLIDYIAVDTSKDEPVKVTEVPLVSAKLSYHGVDRYAVVDGSPSYSYGTPVAAGTFFPGAYTRYGEVAPLLDAVDDKFVVAGQGDQLDLSFTAPQAPASGLARHYVFSPYGYYKDAKTSVAKTVEPLPFEAMSNYPYPETEQYPTDAEHTRYLEEYNTREESGPAVLSKLELPALDGTALARAAGPLSDRIALAENPGRVTGRWHERHATDVISRGTTVSRLVASTAPVHYSVNTDYSLLTVEYRRDSVTTLAPDAGWASAGTTPTPGEPGTPAEASDLDQVLTQNGTYWITDIAAAEGVYNWQLMRYSLPTTPSPAGVRSVRVAWTGHGEPTANHPTALYLWNFKTSRFDVLASGTYGTDTSVNSVRDMSDGGASCLTCHDGSAPAGVKFPSAGKNIAGTWVTGASGDWHGPRVGPGGGASTPLAAPYTYGQSAAIPCETCHDPHGSGSLYHVPAMVNGVPNVSVTSSTTVESLCAPCHTGTAYDWHYWTCNYCHNDADAHEGEPTIQSGTDCLSCHGHGVTFTHPHERAFCHGCSPDGAQWRTF